MVQKKTLFSWILTRYHGLQLGILALIVVTIFCRVFPLEMQKRIVNDAIRFRKMEVLLIYCGLYLGAVVLAGVLKYAINTLQGYIGQKVLYEIRSQLYEHILRLPMPFFRKTSPGMVISFLTSELSAVGEFLGSGLTVPIINILTLITFAGYMFTLNPLLALLSISIYPAEVLLIPILQKRLNRLNQDRIDVTRSLSNTIGEAISGMHEVHGNSSYGLESQKFCKLAGELLALRNRMNILRFGLKFVNNFFQSLGPFMLFLIGGYLAITGRLDLGALVAFLSAYEKLYDPWKELMDYYQDYQDSRTRYQRVMSYFDLEPEFALAPVDRETYQLQGEVHVKDLSLMADERIRLLDQVSLDVLPGQHVALVGFSGSGKSTLAMVLGQLYHYDLGHVLVDGRELKTLTKMDVSANVGYVAQYPFIFDGTIRDNLLYGCQSLQVGGAGGGAGHLPQAEEILRVVQQVGLADDILRFGLTSLICSESHPEVVASAEGKHRCTACDWARGQTCDSLVGNIIRIRDIFRQRWGEEFADTVEFFTADRYLYQTSVLENLVFGYPNGPSYSLARLPETAFFREFLHEVGLMDVLLGLGKDLAQRTVMLLKGLRGESTFFRASPISEEEFDPYMELVERLGKVGLEELRGEEKDMLLRLALRFAPAVHRMLGFTRELEQRILKARELFADRIGALDPQAFTFYRKGEYLYNHGLLDNILFGSIRGDDVQGHERIQQRVVEVLREENLLDHVMQIGLAFQVGSKGDRLSGGQKQKTGLARALLKKPKILVLDEATASLDNLSQARIQHLLETELRGKFTLIAVLHRLDIVSCYDQIAVMKAGRIVECGTYNDLMAQEGIFYGLVRGTKTPM